MPAAPLSSPALVLDQLAAVAPAGGRPVPPADLLAVFERVVDPRKRRGRRHRLPVVLTLATCAVLAGARSFAAIAEWAADAGEAVTGRLGIVRVPDASTFRRVFALLDADALDAALGAWAAARTEPATGERRRVAVDGKTLRGTRNGDTAGRHLLAALPWTKIRTASHTTSRGHGRVERRTVKATEVRGGIDFPHAVQAIQITRRRGPLAGGPATTETIHALTSLPRHQASPALLAALARGHWAIENQLHWVRDLTYDEDHHRARTGNAPQIMASLRNLAITILRLAGTTNIAQALRHHARHPERPLETIRKVSY